MKLHLLLFMIILLFIAGCSKYLSDSDMGGEEFRVGSEGVVVQILDAKNTYFSDELMQLQLFVENKGAFDYPEGKITLSGFDRNIVHIINEELSLPPLQGKNAYFREGDFAVVDIPEDAPLGVTMGESYDTILQADLCYQYKTFATPTVCVVYNPLDQNICRPEQLGLGSQGAPVAVKQVSTEVLRDQVRFTVVVENIGEGIVVNPRDESFATCPYGLEKNDIDVVRFSAEINGLDKPSCSPSGQTVRLNKGIGVFTCTFTLRGQATYTTPLKITLDYGYFDSFKQEITVRNRFGATSGMYTTNIAGVTTGYGGNSGCVCSAANMQRWGGCVCLATEGRNYVCDEGKQVIKLAKKAGDRVPYRVLGNNVVNCGNTANPSTGCPFTGQMTVPGMLFIYGKTSDGRTVSERCNVQI